MLDCTDIAVPRRSETFRRVDIFATVAKRRTFTPEEKARLVAESFASGDSVCAVARRHRVSASQLFAWRKIARAGHAFAPQEITPTPDGRRPVSGSDRPGKPDAQIEISIGSAIVRIPHGVDPETLKRVLDALREA